MVGIGVVGYGYWGPNLVRNFMNVEGARVLGVADLSPKRRTAVETSYPSVKAVESVAELLAMPGIERANVVLTAAATAAPNTAVPTLALWTAVPATARRTCSTYENTTVRITICRSGLATAQKSPTDEPT